MPTLHSYLEYTERESIHFSIHNGREGICVLTEFYFYGFSHGPTQKTKKKTTETLTSLFQWMGFMCSWYRRRPRASPWLPTKWPSSKYPKSMSMKPQPTQQILHTIGEMLSYSATASLNASKSLASMASTTDCEWVPRILTFLRISVVPQAMCIHEWF